MPTVKYLQDYEKSCTSLATILREIEKIHIFTPVNHIKKKFKIIFQKEATPTDTL
jgi:hypothetical protein